MLYANTRHNLSDTFIYQQAMLSADVVKVITDLGLRLSITVVAVITSSYTK